MTPSNDRWCPLSVYLALVPVDEMLALRRKLDNRQEAEGVR